MSIKSNSEIIRDETVKNANTATRVGGVLVEIADDLLAKESQIASKASQSSQDTQDAAIALNTAKVSFPEAPVDGNQYARKDAGWEQVVASGGGTMATTTFTPYSTITSTDGQAAVEELKDELDAAIIGVGAGAIPVKRVSAGETSWDVGTTITASHKLYVDGTKMVEDIDYTVSGSTFTFTGYTATASDIQEYYPDVAVPTTYNASETSIADAGGLITATDVEGALQENRTAINLNTAKVGVTTELKPTDIDTLAKLNAIITDATLIDTTDSRLSDARTPTSHTHTASEVTDFDTEVSNNASVVANTAKVGVTTQISNLSEDTTPQLGGELDFNGHSVGGDAQTATGDGTTTIDWGAGNFFHFQFGAFNEVFTFTAPTKAGTFILKLVQDSVGSRTATFPATVKWSGGTAPTLTTTATTGTDIITFYFDGTNYFAVEVLDFS